MERTYTIPLRKTFLKAPTYHRTNRAVKEVRDYLVRHMKTQKVLLGEELNKALWARGDSKPPSRVTVVAKKEEDTVYAEIAGKEFKRKDFSAKDEKQQKPKKETRGLEAAAQKTEPPKTDERPEEKKSSEKKEEKKTKPTVKKTAKK